MRPDPERVAAVIAEIADAEILPRYRKLEPGAVRAKESLSDLVTVVDEAVERALKSALCALSPGAAFIGEEAASADPSILSGLGERACWIVDPLDGTRNFVRGVDEFGTIVAYVENGQTVIGWIYAAPERSMAIAVAGQGAMWRGAMVQTAPQRGMRPTGLKSTGWLTPVWRDRLVASLKAHVDSASGHCSAYAYLKLLMGEVDFKLASRIHSWDHAAGALILSEAGGAVRWLDTGAPYAPQASRDHPLLATAPGRDWDDIAERLLC
ncbi:MAG: inositol phosphatase [Parvularculaceae bacterium]|nr:inositol phosphatase [Parvularculaceae bacterium]